MVAYGFPPQSILYPVPAYVLAQGEGGWGDGVDAWPLRGLACITQKHKTVAGLACRLADVSGVAPAKGHQCPLVLPVSPVVAAEAAFAALTVGLRSLPCGDAGAGIEGVCAICRP